MKRGSLHIARWKARKNRAAMILCAPRAAGKSRKWAAQPPVPPIARRIMDK